MPITETARRNHELFFPGHVATLAITDPELIEIFDNFAFDEVLRLAPLDDRVRLITRLGALDRDRGARRVPHDARRRAHGGRHPDRGQRDRLSGRAVRRHGPGVRLSPRPERSPHRRRRRAPTRRQATTTAETQAQSRRDVQAAIIRADRIDGLYATAEPDQQHIQHLLTANCFGDHPTRTGLDIPTRELLTFSMLTAASLRR